MYLYNLENATAAACGNLIVVRTSPARPIQRLKLMHGSTVKEETEETHTPAPGSGNVKTGNQLLGVDGDTYNLQYLSSLVDALIAVSQYK